MNQRLRIVFGVLAGSTAWAGRIDGPTFKGGLKAYGTGGNGPISPSASSPDPQLTVTSLNQLCLAQRAQSLFGLPAGDSFRLSTQKGAGSAFPQASSTPAGLPVTNSSQNPFRAVAPSPPAVRAVTLVSPGMPQGGRFLNQPGEISHHELPVNAKPGQAARQDDVSLLYQQSDVSISLPPLTASVEVPAGKTVLNRGDPVSVMLSNGAISAGQYIGRIEGQYVDDQGKQISGVYIAAPQFHGQVIVPANRVTFTHAGQAFQPQLMNPMPTVALQEGTLCATNQMFNSAEMMCLRGIQNGLTRQLKGIAPYDNPTLYNYLRQVASSPAVMQSIDTQLNSQQNAYRQAGVPTYRTQDMAKALEHVEKGDLFGMPGLLAFDFPSAESVPVGVANRKRTSYDQRDKPDRTIILDTDRTRIEADMTYLPMKLRPNDGTNPVDQRTFNGHAVLVVDAYRDLSGRMVYVVLDSNKGAPREFYREDFIQRYSGAQPADYILINPRPDLAARPEQLRFGAGRAAAAGTEPRRELQGVIARYAEAWRKDPEQAPRVLAQGLSGLVQKRLDSLNKK